MRPERADGQRQLPAPDGRITDVVAAVHRFDRVRVVPVSVDAAGPVRHVAAGPLNLRLTLGRRGGPGRLLRRVPPRSAPGPPGPH
ncbi:hypothetical protein OIE73_33350 [Streptomyces hirsutus]|uniref:Uncharacterized protein n=1 Tax=Streptomyces hirsutus TaxID=35620 RepID=A0ABZ1GVD9_9ACTN|nr:hypothetical protein [Streptomyces hirsutus]WSD10132.1 hypothetical protein OIE73_33350 [Streptomyces hirsutus]